MTNHPIEEKIETHSVCDKRLKKEGGKSLCCECSPHDDCGATPPNEEEPIEEKWKIDFRKEFPSFLTDTHNGKIVPIYNGWWVFVQGYKRRNLPQDIEDFIENLLEQERQRMSEEIENLKIKDCSCSGRGDACSICGGLDYKVNRNNILSKCVAIINK